MEENQDLNENDENNNNNGKKLNKKQLQKLKEKEERLRKKKQKELEDLQKANKNLQIQLEEQKRKQEELEKDPAYIARLERELQIEEQKKNKREQQKQQELKEQQLENKKYEKVLEKKKILEQKKMEEKNRIRDEKRMEMDAQFREEQKLVYLRERNFKDQRAKFNVINNAYKLCILNINEKSYGLQFMNFDLHSRENKYTDNLSDYEQQRVDETFKYLAEVNANQCIFNSTKRLNIQKNMIYLKLENCVYSDVCMLYLFSRFEQDKLITYWSPADDPYYIDTREIKLSYAGIEFFKNPENINKMEEIGNFVIKKWNFGFILKLNSIQEIYDAKLSDTLKHLLKIPYFQQLLNNFAYYMLNDDEEGQSQQPIDSFIKTTQDDTPISDIYFPFAQDLFDHQRKEVGWMYNFEQNPSVQFPSTIYSVPLFDSGFYYNINNPDGELQTKKNMVREKFEMGGAILGSEIGSGKTLSIIGLTSIGYQLNDEIQLQILEQTFLEDKNIKEQQLEEFQEIEEFQNLDLYMKKLSSQNEEALNEKQKPQQLKNIREEEDDNEENNNQDELDLVLYSKQQNQQIFCKEKGYIKQIHHVQTEDNKENQKIITLRKKLIKELDYVYQPSLIIVTENILYQWAEEYQKFASFLKVKIIEKAEEFLDLEICEKKSQSGQIFKTIGATDIIITHRKAIIGLFEIDQEFQSNLFKIDFRRIVYDEIHEITNLYQKKSNQQFEGEILVNDAVLEKNIFNFYKVCENIKCKVSWGVTGTLDNLSYRDNTESLGKLLRLHKEYYNINHHKKIQEYYIQDCMRSNPRSIMLPELSKKTQSIIFGQVQKLLYRGKIENRQGEKYAREICSHFMDQYKFLEKIQDQFETAINVIQDKLNDQILGIQLRIEEGKGNIQSLINRLENLQGENNFYLQLINVLQKEKFTFVSESVNQNIQITKKQLQIGIPDFKEQTKPKLGLMYPELQREKKYEMFFKIDNIDKQNKMAIGIFKKFYDAKAQFNNLFSQQDIIINNQQNMATVKEFSKEENKLGLDSKQLRFIFIDPEVSDLSSKSHIQVFEYKIHEQDGKNLTCLGICKKQILKRKQLLHNPNELAIIQRRIKNELPERRSEFLGHGMYMIRGDGLQYSHHDKKQNLYFSPFTFQEGDIVKLTVDYQKKILTYQNITTNMEAFQKFDFSDLEDDQLSDYDEEIALKLEKQYSTSRQSQIPLLNKKHSNINEHKEDDFEILELKKKQSSSQYYNQENLVEFDEEYYNDFQLDQITPCVALYNYKDRIELVSSKNMINIPNFNLEDTLDIGHGAYMISAEGDILSNHDKDLNKSFTNKFGFKQNDRVKITVDLVENELTYTNLTTQQVFLQDIDEQSKNSFSIGALMFNSDNKITSVEQLYIFECPLCFEDLPKSKLVVTNCLHQVCIKCYEALIKQQMAHCPYCKSLLNDKQVILSPHKVENKQQTKVEVLIQMIMQTPKEDKIIVYTQFNDLTHRIATLFDELQLQYQILKGEPSDINIGLKKYKKDVNMKILIMSIEQAASGINVTEANHIFFVHPIFGMSPEKAQITYSQCIGRAYRIGQKKKVYTTLLMTKDSIEEDLVLPFQNSKIKTKLLKQ